MRQDIYANNRLEIQLHPIPIHGASVCVCVCGRIPAVTNDAIAFAYFEDVIRTDGEKLLQDVLYRSTEGWIYVAWNMWKAWKKRIHRRRRRPNRPEIWTCVPYQSLCSLCSTRWKMRCGAKIDWERGEKSRKVYFGFAMWKVRFFVLLKNFKKVPFYVILHFNQGVRRAERLA